MTYSILIIDDVPAEAAEIGRLVTALLDCRVEYASDRYEGWSKLENSKFEAIVLDLNLGGLHEGRLFLEMLRSHMETPPGTVIVSHLGNEPTARELRGRFGFVADVISKSDLPHLPDTLKRALEDAVGIPPRVVNSKVGRGLSSEEERSRLIRKAMIIAAIIGAIGAIVAAIIRVVGGG